MSSLTKAVRWGRSVRDGLETQLRPGVPLRISHDGLSMIETSSEEVQAVVDNAQAHVDTSWRTVPLPYDSIGDGGEGLVYGVPFDGDTLALKVYEEGQKSVTGLDYFSDLLRTTREGVFDTVIPYLATEEYLLMSHIPQEVVEYEVFVRQHPSLKGEVDRELVRLSDVTGIVEAEISDHVFVSRFDPDKQGLEEKYRFFVIDIGYE